MATAPPAKRPRLTLVQRKILTFMLDEEAKGKPTLIASGQKKTRAGYFPALGQDGIGTNTTTLFFLRHHGLVEQVRPSAAPLKGEEDYDDLRYRLTAKGREALKS